MKQIKSVYISCPMTVEIKARDKIIDYCLKHIQHGNSLNKLENIKWWPRRTTYNDAIYKNIILKADAFIVIFPNMDWSYELDSLPSGTQKELKFALGNHKPIFLGYRDKKGDYYVYSTHRSKDEYNDSISGVAGSRNNFLEACDSALTATEVINSVELVEVNATHHEIEHVGDFSKPNDFILPVNDYVTPNRLASMKVFYSSIWDGVKTIHKDKLSIEIDRQFIICLNKDIKYFKNKGVYLKLACDNDTINFPIQSSNSERVLRQGVGIMEQIKQGYEQVYAYLLTTDECISYDPRILLLLR